MFNLPSAHCSNFIVFWFHREERTSLTRKQKETSDANRRSEALHEDCVKQISQVEQKIHEEQVSQFQTRRERHLVETVEQLKRQFSGMALPVACRPLLFVLAKACTSSDIRE